LCEKIGETAQLFRGSWGMWFHYLPRAKYRKALELAEKQLLGLAQREEDPTLLLLAHHAMGMTLFYLGEFVAARVHLEEVLTRYNPEQHHPLALLYGMGDIKVNTLVHYAWALWILGFADLGKEHAGELLSWARELSHPFSLGWALGGSSHLYWGRGEVQAVSECAEEGIAHSTEQGFPHWLAQGTLQRGWVLAQEGHLEEGFALMHQGFSGWKATGMVLGLSFWPPWLAQCYIIARRPEEGLQLLAEAQVMAEETGEGGWIAEVHRLKGELLLLQGRDEAEVEASFSQAIDIARRQSAKSYELRAAVGLGRLWQKQGKREQARELLSEIYGWFTEGFETTDLREAKELLAELG